MRNSNFLISGFLCLVFCTQSAWGQDLQKRTSLKIEKAALTQVLRQLQEQENLRFSYLNNELAGDTIRQFEMHNRPLSEILDKLLEEAGAGYKSYNGQLIIKKTPPQQQKQSSPQSKSNPAPDADQSQVTAPSAAQDPPALAQKSKPQETGEAEFEQASANENGGQEQEKTIEKDAIAHAERTNLPDSVTGKDLTPDAQTENSSFSTLSQRVPKTSFPEPEKPTTGASASGAYSAAPKPAHEEKKSTFTQKISDTGKNIEAFFEKQDADTSDRIRPFHFGIIYPLSTNGVKAPQYVNRLSLHYLVGVAAGLEGVEFSGLGNIEKEYVNGLQFAGMFNLVKGPARGAQFSGFSNIIGGDLNGVQFTGFYNHARAMEGGQYSGFLNILEKDGHGIQAAGFLNIADSLKGAQLSGFMNLARKTNGLQASGFLNIAGRLRGCQLGFINIADSIEQGIPVGFLSFVGNGYKALELYTADDFQANLIFKTGVSKFYNILALGLETRGQERWGYGYGLGSQVISRQRFKLGTDLLAYHLIEGSYKDFPNRSFWGNQSYSQLNKLRILASLQIARRVALFGGPTFNVLVSKYREMHEGPVGSGLTINHAFYDRTHNNTNVKMWFGFNAGLRF